MRVNTIEHLRIRVIRVRGLRQKYHLRVESKANGQVLLTSENYRDHDYVRAFAEALGERLDCEIVETV